LWVHSPNGAGNLTLKPEIRKFLFCPTAGRYTDAGITRVNASTFTRGSAIIIFLKRYYTIPIRQYILMYSFGTLFAFKKRCIFFGRPEMNALEYYDIIIISITCKTTDTHTPTHPFTRKHIVHNSIRPGSNFPRCARNAHWRPRVLRKSINISLQLINCFVNDTANYYATTANGATTSVMPIIVPTGFTVDVILFIFERFRSILLYDVSNAVSMLNHNLRTNSLIVK